MSHSIIVNIHLEELSQGTNYVEEYHFNGSRNNLKNRFSWNFRSEGMCISYFLQAGLEFVRERASMVAIGRGSVHSSNGNYFRGNWSSVAQISYKQRIENRTDIRNNCIANVVLY